MKTKQNTEYLPAVGEIRYHESGGKWRYVCALGEGSGLPSLKAAQAEVRQFLETTEKHYKKLFVKIYQHAHQGQYCEVTVETEDEDVLKRGVEGDYMEFLKWAEVHAEKVELEERFT